MKKSQLVFFPAPAIGHITSTVELAKRLIHSNEGFSITFLIMQVPFEPSISAYIKSLSTSITDIHFVDLPPVEPPSLESYKSIEGFISIFIENHKPHVKNVITELCSKPNSARITGLVIDLFCTTLIDVANELDLPTYIYFTSTAGSLGLLLHLPALHTQITTDFKDSETELIVPSFSNPVPPSVLPTPLLSKKDDSYTWFLYHGKRFRESKGIIVNTFSELEPKQVSSFLDGLTPPVYPVGPLIDLKEKTGLSSDQAQLNERIMEWLDDQPSSSVIFLCFGSMGSFSEEQVREMAIGVEKSGTRFLWVLRRPSKATVEIPADYEDPKQVLPGGFLDRTEGRGFVCGWVPQVEILAHKAIGGFVSHCGWNSILESLWFGVPILTWPLYAEQQLNAFEMVKEYGLAVELKLDSRREGEDLVKGEEVERGIRCLMKEDNDVREKVKVMREKSREVLMVGGSSFTSLGHLVNDLMEGDA